METCISHIDSKMEKLIYFTPLPKYDSSIFSFWREKLQVICILLSIPYSRVWTRSCYIVSTL